MLVREIYKLEGVWAVKQTAVTFIIAVPIDLDVKELAMASNSCWSPGVRYNLLSQVLASEGVPADHGTELKPVSQPSQWVPSVLCSHIHPEYTCSNHQTHTPTPNHCNSVKLAQLSMLGYLTVNAWMRGCVRNIPCLRQVIHQELGHM